MIYKFNALKGIVFCVIGLILLFMPYEKFQSIFPAAKSKVLIKVTGSLLFVFGVFIAVMILSEF